MSGYGDGGYGDGVYGGGLDIAPEALVEISFDDPAVTTPTWTDVSTYARGIQGLDIFSSSRGRDSEQNLADAGVITVNLDNRDRRFDPTNTASPYYPNVIPMRRIRIRATWLTVTYDVFYGYIEDWGQNWDQPGTSNATCTIRAVDAFKALAVPQLAVTDPPADSYAAVVASDNPLIYIPWNEPAGSTVVHCATGGRDSDGTHSGGAPTFGVAPLILGEPATVAQSTAALTGIKWLQANGNIANRAGTNKVTVECWIKIVTAGSQITWLWRGPDFSDTGQFDLRVTDTETIEFRTRIGSATQTLATSALTVGNLYHVVAVYDGANKTVYLNGTSAATVAKTGNLDALTADELALWQGTSSSSIVSMGHLAIYATNLSAARITAHYNAGYGIGFAEETTGVRIGHILDAVGAAWPAGLRNIQTGTRTLQSVRQHGQGALEEINRSVQSEGKDSVFFAAKDGKATFLQNTYRGSSPYNTAQAGFGDGGGAGDWADTILASAPSAWWRLDETTGTNAADSSGNSIAGTYTGGYTLGAAGGLYGIPNLGVTLNGSTGRVAVSDVFDFAGTVPFSLMALVFPTTVDATERVLISKYDGTNGWHLIQNNTKVAFRRIVPAAGAQSLAPPLTASTWALVHATYDGANLRVYTNGVLSAGPTADTSSLANTTQVLNLGSRAGVEFFAGTIDEAAVWNRTLTPTEVAAQHQAFLTEISYEGLELAYDDSFIINHVLANRLGGNLVEVEDTTSRTKYFKRSAPAQSDLLLLDDATVTTHANELLAKYKDAQLRIISITLDGADPMAQTQMLLREIGDAITIKRRPPGGGAVISQLSYIQKIEVSARAGETWKARFVVTPR
jgi:hypothetical protein